MVNLGAVGKVRVASVVLSVRCGRVKQLPESVHRVLMRQ